MALTRKTYEAIREEYDGKDEQDKAWKERGESTED